MKDEEGWKGIKMPVFECLLFRLAFAPPKHELVLENREPKPGEKMPAVVKIPCSVGVVLAFDQPVYFLPDGMKVIQTEIDDCIPDICNLV